MANISTEPPKEAAAILRMAFAFVTSQTLYVAADLGSRIVWPADRSRQRNSQIKLARTPTR
jgi:hypothetical protein